MNDTSAAVMLPLVYTVVRRTLSTDVDVHDVVRATMARVVSEAGGERFRSHVVAVTVDRIREHRRRRSPAFGVPEDTRSLVEIEFVDRPLNTLTRALQRREVARAARWLDDDERELLALWSVERGGHIKAADVAGALGQDARHVAIRLSRVKRRLEAARLLLRALCATPRCRGLAMAGKHGQGRTPLLRHVAGCETCRLTADDLVPVETLFTGAALLPVPDDYAAQMLSDARATVEDSEQTVEIRGPIRGLIRDGAWRVSRLSGPYRRLARLATAKPLLTAVGAGAALVAVVVANGPIGASPSLAAGVQTSLPTSSTTTESSPATTSGPAAVSLVPATSEPPTTTSAPPTTTAAQTTTAAKTMPTTAKAPVAGQSAEAARVVALVNEARAAAGCKPLRVDDRLTKAAQAHSTDMVERGYFSHTTPDGVDPSARMRAAGFDGGFAAENIAAGQSTPEAVMGSWMNSPGHRGNILDCDLSLIGVGVDKRGWRWTQNFGG